MKLGKWWLDFRVGGAKLQRLKSKIASTRHSVNRREAAGAKGGWIKAAHSLLDGAEHQQKHGLYDGAWEHLHEARQQEVYGYDAAELHAAARILQAETGVKLDGWRRAATDCHLTEILGCEAPGDPQRVKLIEAMKVRDEHYDNQYFKLRLVQKQVALLLWLLLILLSLFGALFAAQYVDLTSTDTATAPVKMLGGVLIGAIGACFSGLLSLVSTSPGGTIPERIASTTITFARPAIGAVSGFVAILLLTAGLLGKLPATTILAVAFAFGFSERLAIGAIEKVASR